MFLMIQMLILVALFASAELKTRRTSNLNGKSSQYLLSKQASIEEEDSPAFYTQVNAVNSLQVALNQNPATTLGLKNLKDLEDLKMGDALLTKGVHPEDDSKLRRVAMKALQGEMIRVVITGGSNSAGGGMDKDRATLDKRYFRLFAKWWNNTVGATTGSYMTENLVAIGGTGSYFFAFCYDTFLQYPDLIDIVIVEASVNFDGGEKAKPLEQLTRLLYSHKSQPAIFYVNFVSGLGKNPKTKNVINPNCKNLEDSGQTEVAERYKITSFAMRDFACPMKNGRRVVETSKDGYVASDQKHVGYRTHVRIALMTINYVKGIFDDVIKTGQYASGQIQSPMPSPVFVKEETKLLKNPQCWAAITPDGERNFHRPTLPVKVLKKYHYKYYANGYDLNAVKKLILRKDRQCGWGNWSPGGSIQFEITVDPWNTTGTGSPVNPWNPTGTGSAVSPWNSIGTGEKRRSVIVLIHTMWNGAKGKIWVDNTKDEGIEITSLSRPGGANNPCTIATRVEPGTHTVSVETSGEGIFVVSGIFVGPPDFSI